MQGHAPVARQKRRLERLRVFALQRVPQGGRAGMTFAAAGLSWWGVEARKECQHVLGTVRACV